MYELKHFLSNCLGVDQGLIIPDRQNVGEIKGLHVFIYGKNMCNASEAILFLTAMVFEEQSQSDPLVKRLFIQSEKKIRL